MELGHLRQNLAYCTRALATPLASRSSPDNISPFASNTIFGKRSIQLRSNELAGKTMKNFRKTHTFQLLFVSITVGFFSCSSIKVSTDYDQQADFGKYKTYTLTEEAKSLSIGDLDRRRLIEAVEAGLAAKGFNVSPNGDLLIDLKISTEQKETTTATSNGPYGSAYRYRWGSGFSTTDIDVERYIEGTLFIDLIDATKKQLVWQGRGVKTLDPYATPQEKEQRIKSAVNSILARYPPRTKKK
jgi:hypothetical protein